MLLLLLVSLFHSIIISIEFLFLGIFISIAWLPGSLLCPYCCFFLLEVLLLFSLSLQSSVCCYFFLLLLSVNIVRGERERVCVCVWKNCFFFLYWQPICSRFCVINYNKQWWVSVCVLVAFKCHFPLFFFCCVDFVFILREFPFFFSSASSTLAIVKRHSGFPLMPFLISISNTIDRKYFCFCMSDWLVFLRNLLKNFSFY